MSNSNLLCDFCSAPNPVWSYPARSFLAYQVANFAGESVGDWAACEDCHALIEIDDCQNLAQRSLDELVIKHPEASAIAAILYNNLEALHRQFFEHRNGPAVPIAATAAQAQRVTREKCR